MYINHSCINAETEGIFHRFFDEIPTAVQFIDTGRGDSDFRETMIVETESGEKYVIKLADNDFTFPERINMWKRTAEEYLKLGYYCPQIYCDNSGRFPAVTYKGHLCVAYAEEYAPFRSVGDRSAADGVQGRVQYETYKRDIWGMTAKVAAQYFDYTDYPSAYCLFETFCPSDQTDEVLANALEWKKYADTLPSEFAEQVDRIWKLWTDNRAALEKVYAKLPTSVFQADLNSTNILLDDNDKFVGIYDFNLCGKDVFLNYLMRENYNDFDAELTMIF
ncbi:MAG: phosphotransferase [Acetatifactor sp.]|nr:phosphotransferase [Acetatifactor sp.]